MFNQDKVSQMLAEAEAEALAEAKVKIKQAMVDDLVKQSGVKSDMDTEGPLIPSPIISFEPLETTKEDWEISPLPSAEEDFAETSAFSIKLRVNRAGTKVERFVDGKWINVRIIVSKGRNFSPLISLPNNFCPGSKGKCGKTTCRVSHLVLQAFDQMPKHITDVLFTPKGPSVVFGLRLAYHKDGNLKNCSFDNLDWVSEAAFNFSATRRAQRLGVEI